MTYDYDLNNIKMNLTIEQIYDLVSDLGGEPQACIGGVLHCKTICHHSGPELGEASNKLYYYDNTKLFKCYTGGCDNSTFDVFELVRKVKSAEEGREWVLPKAVQFIADYFGIAGNEIKEEVDKLEDWEIFERYDRIKEINKAKKIIELKTYDGGFLSNLPKPKIQTWLDDGITQTAMDFYEICYEPKQQSIIIPHRNIAGDLVGVRQRTLVDDIAEKFGKYRPLKLGKTLYNHPLSFNLYGIYQNKENITRAKRAIIVEGEKSVLQLESILGRENNIAVACCGSSLIDYQVWLLIGLGVREIIVGLDHDFTSIDSPEASRIIKNLKNIHKKYSNYITISIIWDKNNLTPKKASPSDCGADIFYELYNERINLYV